MSPRLISLMDFLGQKRWILASIRKDVDVGIYGR